MKFVKYCDTEKEALDYVHDNPGVFNIILGGSKYEIFEEED